MLEILIELIKNYPYLKKAILILLIFLFYWIKDVNYSRGYINDYEVSVLKSSDPCWAVKPVCVRRPNISVNKVNGYIFYYVNVE